MSMLGRYLLLLVTMPVDTVVGMVLMLAPRGMFAAYAQADLHRGGLIMVAGSDLVMVALAVILAAGVARDRPRPAGDLEAYNAYLAALEAARRP
jgi:cytochrome c oxidase assembly factor CtaG